MNGGILSKINLLPGRSQYKTWFGLEVDHSGLDASIKIPAYYTGKVEGLCGNFDFDRTNDYQLRDGTVLPYEENLPPYVRSESEYQCANDWIISGDAGPSLDDISNDLPCDISQIDLECEKLFSSEILLPCLAKVDPFKFIRSCKIDLCMAPGAETKANLIRTFIQECDRKPGNNTLSCSWAGEIDDIAIDCPDNSSYRCGDPCRDFETCEWPVICESDIQEVPMCFCDPGFLLIDGNCVTESDADCCTDWSDWSECSATCGDLGEKSREMTYRDQIFIESRPCNRQPCPIDLNEIK
jgi:hypothetical protein